MFDFELGLTRHFCVDYQLTARLDADLVNTATRLNALKS